MRDEIPAERGSILVAINRARTANRMVSLADAFTSVWDCNIQQIKRAEFHVLYQGLFLAERILGFRVESGEVGAIPGYSDFQHKATSQRDSSI